MTKKICVFFVLHLFRQRNSRKNTSTTNLYRQKQPALRRYDEIDYFLFHHYFIWTYGSLHQPSVHTDKRPYSLIHNHFACTVRMYTMVIEKFAGKKKVKALEQLRHFRMIYYGDVKQAVVRHGVRRLPVTRSIAHTNGHDLAVNDVRIYF